MKRDNDHKLTRRRFLEAAVVVSAATSSAKVQVPDQERERLERIVARYGSEIGDLRKVR